LWQRLLFHRPSARGAGDLSRICRARGGHPMLTPPTSARVCSVCVMTDDQEGVVIDANGQCNCCREAIRRMPNEWWPNEQGEQRMAALVEKLKAEGHGKAYDAVVGLSGGVDSAYL